MSEIEKDYYTTQELVNEPWFPVRSTLTVKKLIEAGRLEATNVSTSPRYRRYRISKESAKAFVEKQNTLPKKTTTKKKNNERKTKSRK